MRRLIALPLTALASLALASVALAGGWAQVTVNNPPVDPPAGGETTLNLTVMQHGVTPVSWPHVTVVATDAASGDVVYAAAKAKGPEGSYVATLVFPSAGDWTLTFQSPELIMEGSLAMNVAPALAAVAAASTATATAASTFDALPLALAILALFTAIATAAVLMRAREGAADVRASVRT